MSERKILPCPFCGGEAKTFHIPENDKEEMKQHPNWKWNNPGMWVIGCDTNYMCIGNIDHFGTIFVTEEDAIKTWNTRKPIEKVVDKLQNMSNAIPLQYEYNYKQGVSDGIDKAIEIAKKGYDGTDDVCEWIKYDYRTICPKNHDVGNPYWRIPDNMDKLKYCPYCGKRVCC